MRTIRVADVTVSVPVDLAVLSIKITTEHRQIVIDFAGDTKPTESEYQSANTQSCG